MNSVLILPAMAVFLIATIADAQSTQKTVHELIADLGVEDSGNNTCNTACGIIVLKKDEVVPALQEALSSPKERVRYYSVRCLGEINTKKSREALIAAFSSGTNDVREHAAYALTWNPSQDAEQVYIAFLEGRNKWHIRDAIRALGEIRSKKAVPYLTTIRDHPKGWAFYYESLVALRKIESQELPREIQNSLDFIRAAKYSSNIDASRLSNSVIIVNANLEKALPDVFDICLWVTKENESKTEPNAKTILCGAEKLAYPFIKIGLKDEDENVRRRTERLVEEFGWKKNLKE